MGCVVVCEGSFPSTVNKLFYSKCFVFLSWFVKAPAVVIVEDDLLFSPDFLEYLETNAPVLERDPTTLVLSAWNDNGYAGRVRE